jgi:hypothetical protein
LPPERRFSWAHSGTAHNEPEGRAAILLGVGPEKARIVTAMMSLETRKAVPLPQALRDAIESYRQRTTDGSS